MKTFSDFCIQIPEGAKGPEVFSQCPECSHTRTKSRVKCLSVNIDKGLWCCHHCDWAGSLKEGQESSHTERRQTERRSHYKRPANLLEISLSKAMLDWFHARGITDEVIKRNR